MDNPIILELAAANPNMSDVDRLSNLYHLLSQVLVFGVPGDVVELGCNEGKTSVFLQMVIDHFAPERRLHVFDSFEGLPAPGPQDAYLKEGECLASVEDLEANFVRWGLRRPEIHPGWFEQTLGELPSTVAFAYLDSDFYASVKASLESVYDRTSKNGIIAVDDYADTENNPRAWPGLPGVKAACDEFMADKPERFSLLAGSGDLAMAYLRKGWMGASGRPPD